MRKALRTRNTACRGDSRGLSFLEEKRGVSTSQEDQLVNGYPLRWECVNPPYVTAVWSCISFAVYIVNIHLGLSRHNSTSLLPARASLTLDLLKEHS